MSVETPVAGDLQGFYHVRILIGLVTGLSVTRILTGLARFVQHPKDNPVYLPHLAWTGFLLLYVFHFWWEEFSLMAVPRWAFQDFLFVIFYAALMFVTAALLYPDRMDGYSGFEAYFRSRHVWFYGLLLAIFVTDVADTLLKGLDHLRALGPAYGLRQAVLIALAAIGASRRTRDRHLALACAAIAVELWWIFARFRFLE